MNLRLEKTCTIQKETIHSMVVKFCNIHISGNVVLAPMAGVADSAFRLVCKKWGASLVYTPLISANGLVRNSLKTFRLMQFMEEERPIAIQLFGNDPEIISEAVQLAETLKPDWIDLNFGCPSKPVVKHGSGSALLKDLPRLQAIVRSVKKVTSVPVSAKIRSGWDSNHIVAVEAARILESEGACAVTVHGRTRQMGFKGRSNWQIIRDVKNAVSIPVIGNGDITSIEDGKKMIEETGCDLIMIGRGSYGRPWIFRQMNRYLQNGDRIKEPELPERIDHCIEHYRMALQLIGEKQGVKEMRKHIGWYLRGMPGCTKVKRDIFQLDNAKAVMRRLYQFQKQLTKKLAP
jgi:tRNA-dihydrouridine synthase B